MKDVHLCPILMRTVIWIDGKCNEQCGVDNCPIQILILETQEKNTSVNGA